MTYQRDWLNEAIGIGRGEIDINPKRQHVKALVEAHGQLEKRLYVLGKLMARFHEQENTRRRMAGQEPLPEPPGLKEQI